MLSFCSYILTYFTFFYYRNTPIITSLTNISNLIIQFSINKIVNEKPIEKPAIVERKKVKEIKRKRRKNKNPVKELKLKKETQKKVKKEKVQVKK